MPTPDEVIKKVAEDLQGTCNAFVFTDPQCEQSNNDVRIALLQQLNGLKAAGVIQNHHIGAISISEDGVIGCQIHIQPTHAAVAGIIDIGKRTLAGPSEQLAIQVCRDSNYEDRWEFIQEELMEDEVSSNEKEHQQESRSHTSFDKLRRYVSKQLSLAGKRVLR